MNPKLKQPENFILDTKPEVGNSPLVPHLKVFHNICLTSMPNLKKVQTQVSGFMTAKALGFM